MIEKPQWRGEPAFPQYSLIAEGVFCEGGMTLRDYFAAKALTGFLETAIDWIPTGKQPDFDSLELFKDLARDSYVLADAMLKARDGNS